MNRPLAIIGLFVWLLTHNGWAQAIGPSIPPAFLIERATVASCIHWVNVGNTAHTPPGFKIGRGILDKGWGQFVEHQCGRVVEGTGCRGVWIHNPWGDSGEWPMRWDQRAFLLETIRDTRDAELKAQLTRLEKTFLPTWRKYLRGKYTPSRPKPHVWFYIGTVLHNPTMDAVEDKPAAFTRRWRQSVYPILKLAEEFPGQVSLACDRHVDLPQTHPQYGALLMLRGLGIEVIVEPRPLASHTHLHQFGVAVLMKPGGWDRSDPNPPPQPDGTIPWQTDRASNEQIEGAFYALVAREDREELTAARRLMAEHPTWIVLQPLEKWANR